MNKDDSTLKRQPWLRVGRRNLHSWTSSASHEGRTFAEHPQGGSTLSIHIHEFPTLPPTPALPNTSSDNAQETHPVDVNMVVVAILSALIIFLLGVFVFLVGPLVVRCIQAKIPVSQKRINRRYETIEGWIISKRVRAHDADCERLQRDYCNNGSSSSSSSSSNGNTVSEETTDATDSTHNATGTMNLEDAPKLQMSHSHDTADTMLQRSFSFSQSSDDDEADQKSEYNMTEKEECPICMEGFGVHQVVSWSVNAECGHVFHHECIKEWLVRHANCPFCRCVMLPIDDGKKRSKQDIVELSRCYHRQEVSSFCCSKDGLVFVEPKPSRNKKEWKQVLKITSADTKVDRIELIKLRGERKTYGIDEEGEKEEERVNNVDEKEAASNVGEDLELASNTDNHGRSVQRLEPQSALTNLDALAYDLGATLALAGNSSGDNLEDVEVVSSC